MLRVFQLLIVMASLVCLASGCKSSSEPQTSPMVQNRATTQEKSAAPLDTNAPSTSSSTATGAVWKSVREHAGAGRLAIKLNAADPSVIASESRSGGVQELEIDFASPIRLVKPDAIRAESKKLVIAPAAVRLASPRQLLMQFAGLKEGCYQINLAGAITGADGQLECRFRVLEGDINNDGHISLTDTLSIKSKMGQSASPDNAGVDVDLSGKIDEPDMQKVKSTIRKSVTCE